MSKSKFPHDKYPELAPKVCIRKYMVNGETGVRNGLLLAFPDPNNYAKYAIGYAVTHPSDKWSKTKAIQLALDRACTLTDRWPKVPWKVKRSLPKFLERCNRFFKGLSGPEWVNEVIHPGYQMLVSEDNTFNKIRLYHPELQEIYPDLWAKKEQEHLGNMARFFEGTKPIVTEDTSGYIPTAFGCSPDCNCKGNNSVGNKKSLVPSDFPVDKVERIE